MKTPATQKIFSSEKGQGIVEYALLIAFVAALAISATLKLTRINFTVNFFRRS